MPRINVRKRAAHRRRVQAALQAVLNDPDVMPNADCPDLVVSVSRVEFGHTVREIFVDLMGHPKQYRAPGDLTLRNHYVDQAKRRGEEIYADLTDVAVFPKLMRVVEEELQRRLGLLYTPTVRRICDMK